MLAFGKIDHEYIGKVASSLTALSGFKNVFPICKKSEENLKNFAYHLDRDK